MKFLNKNSVGYNFCVAFEYLKVFDKRTKLYFLKDQLQK